MTIGERIKELRKEQGLTLEQFGARIGIKANTLSQIENSKRGCSDQMALSICREFNVNEEWLREGEGEMYIQRSADDHLTQWLDRVLSGRPEDIRRRMLTSLSRISEAGWDALEVLVNEAERIALENEEDELRNGDPDEILRKYVNPADSEGVV